MSIKQHTILFRTLRIIFHQLINMSETNLLNKDIRNRIRMLTIESFSFLIQLYFRITRPGSRSEILSAISSRKLSRTLNFQRK